MVKIFKIEEVKQWYKSWLSGNNDLETSVELPPLQRGFVWKVNQIEALWDSILRGFPIGSFLISSIGENKYHLLDGQQRATSIAIGYHDPWNIDNNSIWRLESNNNISVVWIDLSPNEYTPTYKFVIRVVTKSHPWGYQLKDNKKILSRNDRINAFNNLKEIDENKKKARYFEFQSQNIYPYDANLPVPLPFLIKAIKENKSGWKDSLINLCESYLPKYINTKGLKEKESYFSKLRKKEFDEKGNIYEAINNLSEIKIPLIEIDQKIYETNENDNNDDDNEEIISFVRFNSGGTRIEGEELIYSIYKAEFPETKKLVEEIGWNGFIAPSRVISLVSRLALSESERKSDGEDKTGEFKKSIKVDRFKNLLYDNKSFESALRELIGSEETLSPAKIYFKKALHILCCKDDNDLEIPLILVKNIIQKSPELFLMLLQWIKIHGDKDIYKERKGIVATLTALHWFCRNYNNKKRDRKVQEDYAKEFWDNLSDFKFWSKPFYKNGGITNLYIMYPIIKPESLKTYLDEMVIEEEKTWNELGVGRGDNQVEEMKFQKVNRELLIEEGKESAEIDIDNNEIWQNFLSKLYDCKGLLLFAQRNYIIEFDEFNQIESLEDTYIPWDWDHIYPRNDWIYNKQGIHPLLRDWANSIGNFRAIALEENRGQGVKSPNDKLQDLCIREKSYIKDDEWGYWKNIKGRVNEKDGEYNKIILNAFFCRIYNIYKDWYYTLEVEKIFE